jgi:hypothetical protein
VIGIAPLCSTSVPMAFSSQDSLEPSMVRFDSALAQQQVYQKDEAANPCQAGHLC